MIVSTCAERDLPDDWSSGQQIEVMGPSGMLDLKAWYMVPQIQVQPHVLTIELREDGAEPNWQKVERFPVDLAWTGLRRFSISMSDLIMDTRADFGFMGVSCRRIELDVLEFLIELDFGTINLYCESFDVRFPPGEHRKFGASGP